MAINDNFVLEISAQIKKDTQKIVQDLRNTIKNIEKESEINLEVKDEKVKQYIEKLKASLNEINAAMKDSNIEANSTSFVRFVDVLRDGAKYSEQIADNLNLASNVAKNLDRLEEFAKSKNKTDDELKAEKLRKDNDTNLKNQIKAKKEIQKLYSDMANDMDKKSNSSEVMKSRQQQISEQYKKLKELEKEQSIIIQKYKEINSSEKLATLDDLKNTKEYESFDKAKNKAGLDLAKRNAKLDEKYSKYSEFNKNEELYNKNENSTYRKNADIYRTTLDEYKAKINEIKNSNVTNFDTSELTEYENKLKGILKILNNDDFKNPKITLLDDGTDFNKAYSEMEKLLNGEGKLIKESLKINDTAADNGIVKMTGSFRTADKQIKDVTYTFNELTGAITRTKEASKSADITSKFDTFGDKLNKKFGDLTTYLLSFASFYEVVDVVKQGFSIIKDLDTQLTEMQKVSNESLSNLQQYANNSFDIAEKIGTTGSQLQSSTADYMRLGKSLQDATKLAQDTNILMNVSEFDSIDQATESMISMTQAYQELDSMDIIDKLNLTGNNYSISTNELAQSLQKSSSALKTAKNDFDEAIALTVAGNSVVQDPDSVAAGIRTIALRMTGTDAAKKELEDLGEETDNVLTRSKLNDTLEMLTDIDERGGISLLDDNGNYRSITKTLIELAERWKEIGEQDVKDGQNRQNALLEALAGKNRSNILASILNDPNLLKNVYNDVSTNYQGSAWKENEKQMQSIEGHLKQLKNTWEEFWASDKNREFVNDIIDLANAFLELLNSIGGAKTALAGLFGLFVKFNDKANGIFTGLFSGLKNIVSEIAKTGDSSIIKSFLSNKLNKKGNIIEESLDDIVDNSIGEVSGKAISDSVDSVSKEIISDSIGEVSGKVLSSNLEKMGTNIEKFGVEVVSKSTSKAVSKGAVEGAKIGAVEASSGGLMNIAKFLFTTPVGLAITAFVAKSLYDSYYKGLKEASEKFKNDVESYTSKTSELNNFKENIPDLAKEYDSLKKGVNAVGENVSLTTDEFQRYKEITNQIASNFPSLIDGYDSTGNAIVNLTNSLDDLNNAYNEVSKKNAYDFITDSKIGDVRKSFLNYSANDSKDSIINLLNETGVQFSSDLPILNKFPITFGNKKAVENSNKVLEEMSNYIQNSLNDNELSNTFKKIKTVASNSDTFELNKYIMEEGIKGLAFNPNESNALTEFLSNLSSSTDDEDLKKSIDGWETYIYESVNKYQELINNSKQWMVAYSQTKDKYYDMDETERAIYDSFVKNFSKNDYEQYEGKNVNKFLNKYSEYIKNSNNKEDVTTLSNWKSLLTGSNGTIGENEEKIQVAKNRMKKELGLDEETINNRYNIDPTILDEQKNKLAKFYSDVNTEAEKQENKTNKNIVNKYKDTADKKEEIINKFVNNISGTELKNITDNLDNIDIDKVLNDYETKYKQFYSNRDEYISDYVNSLKNIEPNYLGENKSFAQLETNASSYSSTLAQINNIGNDNVVITEEMANTLKGYGSEFSEYVQSVGDGSTYIITNIKAVQGLITKAQKKASMDARNSKEEAIKNYKNTTDTLVDLTDQLEKTATSEGKLDESILKNIQSTESQINTLKRNIQYYEQLETKLLGATNAFDAYNLAVQQDESQNAYSTATSMVDTLKEGFETGRLGTEAFKASIQGILSDSNFNDIMNTEDLDKRYNLMKKKYDDLKKYFKKDSNGKTSISGIQNFINDAYKNDLLTSNNLDNFAVKDNVDIDDFVEKLGYSKEIIYAMGEEIRSYDFNWGQSFFDGLTSQDGFSKASKDIEEYTDQINKNNKAREQLIIQRSKLDKTKNKEEWNTLTKQIEKYSSKIALQQQEQEKIYNTNTKNVLSYIDTNKKIKEEQTNVDLLNKKLEQYKKAKKKGELINGKAVTDEQISKLELDTRNAEEKLGKLLSKKNKLGEPTELNLTLAKEKLEKELDDLKKNKVEIAAELVTTNKFVNGNSILNNLNNKDKIKKIDSKIKETQANIQSIDVMLGIDANTTSEYDSTIAKIETDKKELNEDVDFDIKAKGVPQTINSINSVKTAQDTLKDKDIVTYHTIVETTVKKDGGAKAVKTANATKKVFENSGFSPNSLQNFLNNTKKTPRAFGQNNSKSTLNYFGKAYANGKLSNISSHASGNTLVGELGAETVVDPWEGTYKVVGINGAEFINIPKDAIVFNHQQTKELQKTGRIKSRGAIVSNASGFMQGFAKASPYKSLKGNAFPNPQGSSIRTGSGSSGNKSTKKKTSSKSSKSKPKSSKSNSSSKEVKGLIDDIFDWIEIRLQRLSDKTQRYITLAENALDKSVKELGYKYAISSTKSEINNNQSASKKYKSYANALVKKAKKNGVTNASAYAKKVRDGSIDLQKITNEKTLDFVNSYKDMYEKAKECDSAILSLTAQLSDLAESFYNLPTEYAEKKIEKFSDEMDVLSSKLDIYNTYQNKNKTLDQQISLQKNIYNANQSAYKNTYSNLKSAKSKINSTKDSALKGLISKQKKSIVASVNANKEIHISPKYSATLQSAIANYNKALEANRIASNNAKKASAEYTKVLRENTNAKYENIKSYYDTRRSWDDARLSAKDAKLEYRTSMGYSNTSKTQKQVLKDKLSYEQDKYNKLLEEKSKFNRATLDKQFKEGKLSREDYYSQISHIEELDENIYTTATSINNLNKEIKNLKITHLDYVIDGIKNTLEKFKNYISLKEVRGDKATETDYTDQIKYEENQIDILYNKYKELEDEKASYAVESEEYKRVTEEQASIESEALQARQNIDEIVKSVNSIRFKPLEDANASLERQIDDYEHLKDILSKDELIDDNGNFTDSGLANMALIGKQMEASKKLIVNYRTGLEKLTESYKNGNLTLDEYNEQSREYIKSIQDAVSAVDNYRSALIDMYKQQLEAENETLQKTIDKRKEALEAKKRCVKMPVFI